MPDNAAPNPPICYGLIAGNGRFPLLVLEAARSRGVAMVVAAIREETDEKVEQLAARVYWISLGQLGRLIEIFRDEGITEAIMAGQVKHKQIFSAIRPDWKMMKLLASLAVRNTDSLIGAVARALEQEGIHLQSSTAFLEPLLAGEGVMTRRSPTAEECADIEYGLVLARHVAAMDIGQTVVVAERACLAVEAMEGTDATIRRAATLANGRALTVVKVAKPKQDVRFDVPVIGALTIAAMRESGARALAVEAGITLLLDRDEMLRAADNAGISIIGVQRAAPAAAPDSPAAPRSAPEDGK
jgi:DUF1009 family protein